MEMSFFTLIWCKNCNDVCLKRPKINEKEARVGPFFFKKKLFVLTALSLSYGYPVSEPNVWLNIKLSMQAFAHQWIVWYMPWGQFVATLSRYPFSHLSMDIMSSEIWLNKILFLSRILWSKASLINLFQV